MCQLSPDTLLRELLAASRHSMPDPVALEALRRRIRECVQRDNAPTRKALLRTLVAKIVVRDRNTVRPFFRIPVLTSTVGPNASVREVATQVDLMRHLSNRQVGRKLHALVYPADD
jgi:hypothetical protein